MFFYSFLLRLLQAKLHNHVIQKNLYVELFFLVASRSRRLYILLSSFFLSYYLQDLCYLSVRRFLLISLGIINSAQVAQRDFHLVQFLLSAIFPLRDFHLTQFLVSEIFINNIFLIVIFTSKEPFTILNSFKFIQKISIFPASIYIIRGDICSKFKYHLKFSFSYLSINFLNLCSTQ